MGMSDTRVHLRFAQELKPGASVEALRCVFLLPNDVATVADVNHAISVRFQLQSVLFTLQLRDSQMRQVCPD